MSHPTYEINTVNDMLAIPADRIDAFLADLKLHLEISREALKNMQALAASCGMPLATVPVGLTWTDDGVNAIRGVNVTANGQTEYLPNPAFKQ